MIVIIEAIAKYVGGKITDEIIYNEPKFTTLVCRLSNHVEI